jgi:hypothetical protein
MADILYQVLDVTLEVGQYFVAYMRLEAIGETDRDRNRERQQRHHEIEQ